MGGVEQIKKDDKIGTKTLRTGRDLHFRRCVVRILTKKNLIEVLLREIIGGWFHMSSYVWWSPFSPGTIHMRDLFI